jgi:pimeloyl-ACP methyl ester carboxylesterase
MDLAYHVTGDGPPVLLVHGGAEDADMLAPLATALASRGRRAIRYDRRGTGASSRADWPGGGADQHADDAARLLQDLMAAPATVLGFSSGGLVALALAARHPDLVSAVIAWEPPAVTLLPGGEELRTLLQAPSDQYLAEHPGDWVGGFHVLLRTLSDGRADLSSPEVRRAERNAEAILRDDGPLITARTFTPGELPAEKVVIATSEAPEPLHAETAARLAALIGREPVRVAGAVEHEAYLCRPEVLADFALSGVPALRREGASAPLG